MIKLAKLCFDEARRHHSTLKIKWLKIDLTPASSWFYCVSLLMLSDKMTLIAAFFKIPLLAVALVCYMLRN
jgi:hypothetical protein